MATWEDIVNTAHAFPGVEESLSYGEPSLKVGKKLLTRYRPQDNSIVLNEIDIDERKLLLNEEPNVFFLEPHYQNYQIILVRLSAFSATRARPYLERRWRCIALKKHIKDFEENND